MAKRRRGIHRHSHRLVFEVLEHRQLLASDPVITEFMARNSGFLQDGDGNTSDWIEVYNAGDAPVDLGGYRLTDKQDNLSRWVFPSIVIQPNGYLVVFASGQDVDDYVDAAGNLHTNFALDADGEYLALAATDGAIVSQYGSSQNDYPPQLRDVSFGLGTLSGGDVEPEPGYMATATPGLPNVSNEQVFVGFVADTTFSVRRGFYTAPQTVAITTATPGASVYFSTDGSQPGPANPSASRYAGSLLIESTTVLRAAAFKDNYIPSTVQTATYLFLNDVIHQPTRPPGFPTKWWAGKPADYGMNQAIVQDPAYRNEIIVGLQSIPTMSIVMDTEDLFGPEGIYVQLRRGRDSERPTSVEIIDPAGGDAYQVDAGIRIHGNDSRDPYKTRKYSFRLAFRDEYGAKKLTYPLFPDAPVDRFDNIVLRAGLTGRDPTFMRDAFGRATARHMGKIDGHATFVHLYLNGLYWGLYNAVERPDAKLTAEYFGGDDDEYDSIHMGANGGVVDGDRGRYDQFSARGASTLFSTESFEEIERYVDLDSLFDFLILSEYLGSDELRITGSRTDTPHFRYFLWDLEFTLRDGPFVDTKFKSLRDDALALGLRIALSRRPDLRMRFADQVHKHFFNGGALTVEALTTRWQQQASDLHAAIIGESARWGNTKPLWGAPRLPANFTRDTDWTAAVATVTDRVFPSRGLVFLRQLRTQGYYPSVDAPLYDKHGGTVASGFELTMDNQNAEGTLYFTLDGTDPRLAGGDNSPTSIIYDGTPIALIGDVTVKSRILLDGEWSALNQASFVVMAELDAETYEAGDVNRDHRFDRLDIVQVLQAAKFQTGRPADWVEGDWDGDRQFNRMDIVAALQTGNYLAGPYAANSPVEFVLAEFGSVGSKDSSLGSSVLAQELLDSSLTSSLDSNPFAGHPPEWL